MPRARVVIFGWADRVHVQRWAKGLAGRGYQVKVISQGGTEIKGIETVCFPRRGKVSYFRYAAAAAHEARRFKPDITHVHYAGGFGLWGLKTNLQPLVVSVWGSDLTELPRRFYLRFLIRRTLKKAALITATSNVLRDAALRLLPAARDRVALVPFGVDIPAAPGRGIDARPVKICYIKAHERIYGPHILLKAIARVREEIPDIQLSMAGEGRLTGQLRRMITELGLESNVRLVGFINNEEISNFIRSHHFMVMPSMREAFGVAVLEASACERPVIASDTGGVPEVLVDKKTGILVPKGDVASLAGAITRLANDSDLRDRMGREGKRFVQENYTWEKSLDTMTDLYEHLLHGKK